MKRALVVSMCVVALGIAVAQAKGPAPVEFKYLGISADKAHIKYEIKIGDKPVEQVDLHVNYLDAAGKSLLENDLVWQNIVGSTRKPIENGKTYVAEDYLYPDSAKVTLTLKRVVFKDKTTWTP